VQRWLGSPQYDQPGTASLTIFCVAETVEALSSDPNVLLSSALDGSGTTSLRVLHGKPTTAPIDGHPADLPEPRWTTRLALFPPRVADCACSGSGGDRSA
jgi:hypothetical protein